MTDVWLIIKRDHRPWIIISTFFIVELWTEFIRIKRTIQTVNERNAYTDSWSLCVRHSPNMSTHKKWEIQLIVRPFVSLFRLKAIKILPNRCLSAFSSSLFFVVAVYDKLRVYITRMTSWAALVHLSVTMEITGFLFRSFSFSLSVLLLLYV